MKEWDEAKTGRHSNANDYVRDLIRRDQVRSGSIAQIQALITEGLESGIDDRSIADLLQAARRQAMIT